MDAYSYLSVLLSIILGLAITQLLQGVRGIALARGRVRMYWPSLMWGVLLFLIFVQSWWAMFGLRNRPDWTFEQFLVVVLHNVLLYLLAALVFPDFHDDPDLRAHYHAQARLFYSILILATLASLAKDLVLDGHLPEWRNVGFHLMFIALAAGAIAIRREWYHRAAVMAGLIGFVFYIGLLFTRLT